MMRSRRAAWCLVACLCCLSMAFGPSRLTNGDLAYRTLTPSQLTTLGESLPPETGAASAMLVDLATGQILYANNEHERRAPASLTKLVTAMVALDRSTLDQQCAVWPIDLAPGTVAAMRNGEWLSVRQLLHMLLIPSDNAAANVLARNLAGDIHTYVGWMNDLMASWGLEDTHFANCHGLDQEGQYSSAYDMAIIARNAMAHPVIAEIVGIREAVVAKRWILSTNELLNAYQGTVGVKTGTTDEAGQCLIAVVHRRQGDVLSVVLGSQDRYWDTRLLLDYYYDNFAVLRIDLPEMPLNRLQDEAGNWHTLFVQEPVMILVSPAKLDAVTFYRRVDHAGPVASADGPIGALEVMLDGHFLLEVPMYAR